MDVGHPRCERTRNLTRLMSQPGSSLALEGSCLSTDMGCRFEVLGLQSAGGLGQQELAQVVRQLVHKRGLR